MYCPACNQIVENHLKQCHACGHQIKQVTIINPLTNASPSTGINMSSQFLGGIVSRIKLPVKVTIAITIDRTGSSKTFQVGITKTIASVLPSVEAKAQIVNCYLQSHGDLDDDQLPVLHSEAVSPSQIIQDAQKICYGGGGDLDEHHLDGIESLLQTVPWSLDKASRSVMLVFVTADSKPARSGRSPQDIGKAIKDRGIMLFLVGEPDTCLEDVVNAAKGFFFPITNDPTQKELETIAGQISASIAQSISSGTGTVPMPIAS